MHWAHSCKDFKKCTFSFQLQLQMLFLWENSWQSSQQFYQTLWKLFFFSASLHPGNKESKIPSLQVQLYNLLKYSTWLVQGSAVMYHRQILERDKKIKYPPHTHTHPTLLSAILKIVDEKNMAKNIFYAQIPFSYPYYTRIVSPIPPTPQSPFPKFLDPFLCTMNTWLSWLWDATPPQKHFAHKKVSKWRLLLNFTQNMFFK